MRHTISIIDDFLDDPHTMRKNALAANYSSYDGHTYPGKNSEENFLDQTIQNKIEHLIGKQLVPHNDVCGKIRVSLESDVFLQDIHVDPRIDLGGVLYLNYPTQCIPTAGTSFWYHKKLGMERCPNSFDEGKVYGYTKYEEIIDSIVYGDGLDRSKWERYAYAPMKYNRLVLFDPMLWHSHGDNFGTDINNGRLVMLFFFDFKK